jgi:hypothetical protein
MIQPPGRPATSAEARDRGLRRIRAATGWTTVASTVGAVVLAAGYAGAAPGNSTSNPNPVSPAGSGRTDPGAATGSAIAPATTPSTSPAGGLQPPVQAPAPTKSPPQVVSGAS